MVGEVVKLFDADKFRQLWIANEEERRSEVEQADESKNRYENKFLHNLEIFKAKITFRLGTRCTTSGHIQAAIASS